ncbi:MAG: ABC transporter ATP-binding protein/permease [Gemmatimonadota bacterium]|nr:ABC transporter ATP-binding protein/permease [Gemmatimonadota bacterium]
MRYAAKILRYLQPYWRLAVVAVLLILLSSAVGLLGPWPLKILVDHALGGVPAPPWLAEPLGPLARDRVGLLVFAVLAGFGLTVVDNVLNVLGEYVTTRLDQRMVLDFRSDLFEHAQRLSLSFHDQRRTGDFMARINFAAGSVGRITVALPPLAQSLITLVGMFWIAYNMDPTLALLSLTVVPFIYYSVGFYTRYIGSRVRAVQVMEGESLSIVHEAMAMLRVIVAFGREGHEYRRFREHGESAVDARVKLTVQQTVFSLVVNTITAVGSALVLGYGAYQVLRARLTVGELLIIMSYITSVYRPLETISGTVGSLQEQLISLKMACELQEAEPEIKDASDAVTVERARGRVTFEGVSFSYQGRVDTLKELSFDAPVGKVIAVVGPTGAGKSTLVSLIPRFFDPQRGRVMLDGTDVRQITLRSLRQQISIVLQEPLLFAATIADNIRYGRLEASEDELREAALAANAHDFVMRLPDKYETILGERGAQLSGGERQRIAVARAFLKDAPVLILDEPTSSIDSKTELVILDALERLMVGRTTFIVAHRLSTIRNADHILVLNHGRLVEQGRHEELLARQGLYRELYDAQNRHARGRPQPVLRHPAAVTAEGG